MLSLLVTLFQEKTRFGLASKHQKFGVANLK